jgi:hypothetical protein
MNRGKQLALIALLTVMVVHAAAQARVDATGRPLLVMDDSLGFVPATLVYKSAGEEFYVPDLTRPYWVGNRSEQLATSGAFSVFVYAYHVSNRGLHGYMVDISLEKKTASIYDFATPHAPPTVLSLTSSASPLMAAINLKILPVVKREMQAWYQSVYGPPPPPVGSYSPATH